MDAPLLHTARAWLGERRPAVLVEVSAAQGSVPRGVGTRMLVAADTFAGTIGGGHLELKAIDEARRLLVSAAAAEAAAGGTVPVAPITPFTRHYPLGPALGQCCGGAVTLRFERLTAAHVAGWPAVPPLLHLQLYGAGHVGRAIARLLATLPVAVDWIDSRDDEFPPALLPDGGWPPHIRRVVAEDDGVDAEVATAPPGAFFLVLTHRHDLDLAITEAILRRPGADFGFLGLIGSKTKRQRFIHRFEATGIAPETIARMTCPVGIAGIGGKEPAVIAASIAAQLLLEVAP